MSDSYIRVIRMRLLAYTRKPHLCTVCQKALPTWSAALCYEWGKRPVSEWGYGMEKAYVHTACVPVFGLIAVTDYELSEEAQGQLQKILARDSSQPVPVVEAEDRKSVV